MGEFESLQPQETTDTFSVLQPRPTHYESTKTAIFNQLCDAIFSRDMERFLAAVEKARASTEILSMCMAAEHNRTPLHLAIQVRNRDMCEELIDAGAPVGSIEDDCGMTPIDLALASFPEVVYSMVTKGKEKNLRKVSPDGQNLLHRVVFTKNCHRQFYRLPVLQELVENHNVSPKLIDNFGYSPAEWAREHYLFLGSEGDKIIQYLENPPSSMGLQTIRQKSFFELWTLASIRIIVMLLLIALHCISYLADESFRRNPEGNAKFMGVYHVINFFAFGWSDTSSNQVAMKVVGIVVGGAIAAVLAVYFIHHFLLRIVFRFRFFGHGGLLDKDSYRGVLFVIFYVLCFAYYGIGVAYNALLKEWFDEKEQQHRMINDIHATNLQTLKGFAIIAYFVDILLFWTLIDTMAQQGISKSSLIPSRSHSSFCSCCHFTWKTARYILFWLLWLSAVAGAVVVLVLDNSWFDKAVIETHNRGQRLAIYGLCLFLTVCVMSQQWTLPYMYSMPQVNVPGFGFSLNNEWFAWWLCSLVMICDGHMLATEIDFWVRSPEFEQDPNSQWLLGVSLIPAGLAVLLLLFMLIRNIGWCNCWPESTTPVSDFTELYEVVGSRPSASRTSQIVKREQEKTQAKRHAQSHNVWCCAYNDDVIMMCAYLDAKPSLLNQRGGDGLIIDHINKEAVVSHPARPEYAATPLHYAIAGNARSTTAALLARGANIRQRTSHGLWTCQELASIVSNTHFLDVVNQELLPPTPRR